MKHLGSIAMLVPCLLTLACRIPWLTLPKGDTSMPRILKIVGRVLLASTLALPLGVRAAPGPVASQRSALLQASTAVCPGCSLGPIERRLLTDEVAEYSVALRVGPGEFDIIGLHRVVKEQAPFVPSSTSGAVLLAHGDVWPFDAAFLASAASAMTPDDHALPIFLAAHGLDVWGIDFRWTRVPLTPPDGFSFMADWGIETDARDLGIALAVARVTRALTGHGFGKLHLLGWSRGGQIGYAYLNAETQVPAPLRQVKGFIPVDIYLKTNVPELQQGACIRYANEQARIDGGEIAESIGQVVNALGVLASTAPNASSPIIPGLTNEQAGLLAGAATFLLLPPGLAPAPFYHFTGGSFDTNGLPTGLLYTDEQLFFTFLAGGSPWQPLKELAEADAAICDGPEAPDVPWDDHLGAITVPILYVGAGGGFGDLGIYTTTLLDSDDVSTLVVSFQPPEPPELRLFDFGHADLFQADDAPTLVWEPILAWLQAH